MFLTYRVLGRQLHVVGVKELQEGAVHREGELVDLDHLLQVLVPVGLEHGPEVFTPATGQRTLFLASLHHISAQTLSESTLT